MKTHNYPETIPIASFLDELASFREFGTPTRIESWSDGTTTLPLFINEFWTAKQRAANSLHEISYRACFKPQLPRFFVERLSSPGETVYDPFLGRGTTVVEAALLRRRVVGCDINPLSAILTAPRLRPPTAREVHTRLAEFDWTDPDPGDPQLLTFYHPETLRELSALRSGLAPFRSNCPSGRVDNWIRMTATNRLTGHSAGFFSVYTLPPNQALTVQRQQRINRLRNQTPPRRSVPSLILRKTNALLKTVSDADRLHLEQAASDAILLVSSADRTPDISHDSIDLIVTSPPFLDVVDYAGDNWLRCWFNGVNEKQINIWAFRKPDDWVDSIERLFRELLRILKPGGYIAFEVGEVRRGKIKMEELVIPAARNAQLLPILLLVNSQEFTKTSNCWGVTNQIAGTNTNRVVLLRKPI